MNIVNGVSSDAFEVDGEEDEGDASLTNSKVQDRTEARKIS